MSRVQLLPWCDETKQMDDIYVTLKLKDKRIKDKSLLANNEDLVTLTTSLNVPATRVLVKGVAGSGKSTLLAKLAYSWAQQNKKSPLSQFQLVFILSLREVQPKSSIIDAIFQQLFESETTISKEGLENYIKSHPHELLLLVDGFDEYSATDLSSPVGKLEETLAFKVLRQCRTILSTRPHKDLNLHHSPSPYLSVQVLGFSSKNVELYITKFFRFHTDGSSIGKGLIARLHESDMLASLSTIPVMLMLECLLWEDQQKLPDTQSQLYREFVLYLWKKYCMRQQKNVSFDGKIEQELKEAILKLGTVALDGICPKKNIKKEKIVFSDIDFHKNLFSLGCNTGLLTRERLRSKLNTCSSITFLHKSFQEFCAASCWATLYASAPDQFKGVLERIRTWQLLLNKFELVKFCCGLVEKEGILLIIQHAIRLYSQYGEYSLKTYSSSTINVGHNKSDSNRKHVIPILTLLYESQNTLTGCKSGEITMPQQLHGSQKQLHGSQSLETISSERQFPLDQSVKSHQSTGDHALNSLAQSLKSVLPDDKLELDISYNYPVSTSIFHNFVKSELGFLTLSTCNSCNIVNPYTKLEVIVDTLKCLSGTSKIDITLTHKQSDKSEPNKNSLTLLGDALAALPKLNEIKLDGVSDDRMPDVSILLHHLSISPNGSNYAHITVKGAMINMSVIVQFLSKVTQLKLLDMENMKITESDKSSGETVQSTTIQHFSLQFTSDDDAMKLQRSDMDPSQNALQNAKLTLIGCDTDILPHHLCTMPYKYSHIRFKKVVINVTAMVQFLSKVEHLKQLHMEVISVTRSDMDSDGTLQSSNTETTDTANQNNHIGYLSLLKSDVAIGSKAPNTTLHQNSHREVRMILRDCNATDLILHHMSFSPTHRFSHFTLERVVTSMTSVVHFLSKVEQLKLAANKETVLTRRDMVSGSASPNYHIKYFSLQCADHMQTPGEAKVVFCGCTDDDDRMPDVSILLHHLSTSPNGSNYAHITVKGAMINVSVIVQFLSKVTQLKLLDMENIKITESDKSSGEIVQSTTIQHFSLQFTSDDDAMKLQRSDMDPSQNALQNAKLTLIGCDTDILPHHLCTMPYKYSHIRFKKVVINVTAMVQFLSKVEHLKQLHMEVISVTRSDMDSDGTLQSSNTETTDTANQNNHIGYLSLLKSDVAVDRKVPNTTLHQNWHREVRMILRDCKAADLILHHMSFSPTHRFGHFTLERVVTSMTSVVQFLSKVEQLKLAVNIETVLTRRDMVSSSTSPNYHIEHFSLECADHMQTSGEAKAVFCGCTDDKAIDILLEYLTISKNSTNNVHVTFEKVVIDTTTMLKLLTNLKCLKSLELRDIDFTPVDGTAENRMESYAEKFVDHQLQYHTNLTRLVFLKEKNQFEIISELQPTTGAHLQHVNLIYSNLEASLKSLTQMPHCCNKLHTLNVYSASLNEDHIQLLSEFLPQVSNLQVLDLSNNIVGMTIGPLTQQLQHCTKLTTLNLRKTGLEEDHIKILSELFPKVSDLQVLDLSDNTVRMAIGPLTQQLQHCTKLTTLNLYKTNLQEDHIKILSELFPKVSNLQVLDLSDNTVGMATGHLTQQLQHCTKLVTLNLHNSSLKEDHIKILSELFPKVSNLLVLDLSDNTVGMAIRHLTQQLQHCTKLTTLNLHNTSLKEDHIKILSELFLKVSNLQVLDLPYNNVGMAIGHLTQQLQHCTKLSTLNLHNTSLKEDHIKILSELFSKVSNLQVLDLSDNTMGMVIRHLTQQLQHCTKLTTLNLNNVSLKEDHITILTEFLPKTPNLQVLDLSGNTVGMTVVKLAQQLQYCTSLNKLHLHWAQIPDQGIIELAQRFDFMPNLTWLDISRNGDHPGYFTTNIGVDAVFKNISKLTKLEHLHFYVCVDQHCSALVKDCMEAIGRKIPCIYEYLLLDRNQLQTIKNVARKYL